jgi:hypothetical protein
MRKWVPLLFLMMLLSLASGYTVFWLVMKDHIRQQIEFNFARAAEDGLTVEGDFPAISGFPLPHRITFSGTVGNSQDSYIIPALEVRGFLLPGWTVTVSLPEGIAASGPSVDGEIWSLDYLTLAGPVPATLPDAQTMEAMRDWRDGGGKITITHFDVRKKGLEASGNGELLIDGAMQPSGYFNTMIKGYAAFVGFLQEKKLVEPRDALITSAVLNGLASQDPEDGSRFLKASLTLQNSRLLLGPVQILALPVIAWPYENMPTENLE